jgi:glycosyltransferase involved in cell wall biosynthesis
MSEQQLPELGEPVSVAWVTDGETVTHSFLESWTGLLVYDQANRARTWRARRLPMKAGTGDLPAARNAAIVDFLSEPAPDWLFWVDTDMGFPPDIIDRLFEAADPADRPVVGALAFASIHGAPDGAGGWSTTIVPTLYDWARDPETDQHGFAPRWDYPRNTVTRVAGTGSACILIHRSVLERIRDEIGPCWYDRRPNPSMGRLMSEDLSFCTRVNDLGLPVFVHTGVATTHAKTAWLSEGHYWRERAVSPAPWKPEPPAATERTWTVPRYAIIPTHNRPARLLALVASLGPQCDGIIVLDNASEPPVDELKLKAAATRSNVKVIRDPQQPPHLSRFWNVMLDRIAEDADGLYDVAVLNDDAIVPAGWYDACSNGLRGHETAVIAHTSPTRPALLTELGNDPGNRMTPHAFVLRGESGLRADEAMRWWYFDSDLDQRARLAGGVLSVSGPRVLNSLANTTTVGALAEQAEKDRAAFDAKWGAA